MLRGAVLAALTAVLTVAGHLAGGGTAPDLSVLVVLLPLAAGGFATVAERSRSGWGALLVLGVGQLVLHRLIEMLAPVHLAHHAAPSTPKFGTSNRRPARLVTPRVSETLRSSRPRPCAPRNML